MSPEFENLLYLFGCGATGKKANPENCIKLSKIREKALSQNVWPVVFSAVRPLVENGEIKIPPEIYAELEKTHMANIFANVQRVEFTKTILEKMVGSGIECCMIKGTTLAELYYESDMRISGDTDILIPTNKEKEAGVFLEENGYNVEKRESGIHHFAAVHPVGGLLEVHIELMQKTVSDMAFYNKVEYNEPYLMKENGIKTLGFTDGLIYNTVHFIKHFVKKGAGIRHMMDMLLYMHNYKEEIDWNRFDSLMKELRYDKLIDAVKTVGEKYWGIKIGEYSLVEDDVVNLLLSDIENGGVFGKKEDRKEVFRIFSQCRSDKTEAEFRRYSISHFDKSLFRKVFPEKQVMKKTYPNIGDNVVKLFFAYIKRWFTLVKDAVSGKRSVNEYFFRESSAGKSDLVQKRLHLMEKLDMIDSQEKNSK